MHTSQEALQTDFPNLLQNTPGLRLSLGCPACSPRAAQDGCKHSPAQIINVLNTFFCSSVFVSVCVYLTVGPRQLFFVQCGPETPKGWANNACHYPACVPAAGVQEEPAHLTAGQVPSIQGGKLVNPWASSRGSSRLSELPPPTHPSLILVNGLLLVLSVLVLSHTDFLP